MILNGYSSYRRQRWARQSIHLAAGTFSAVLSLTSVTLATSLATTEAAGATDLLVGASE
jgi:hypothetical protein